MNRTGTWIVVSIFTWVGLVAGCGVDPELHRRTVARADRNQQRYDRESKASARLRFKREHWKKIATRSQAMHRDAVSKLKASNAALAKTQKSLKFCKKIAHQGGVVAPRGVIDPRVKALGKGPSPAERRRQARALKLALAKAISQGKLTARGGRAFLKRYYTKRLKKCGDRHLPITVHRRHRRRKTRPKTHFSATVTLTVTLAGNGRVRRARVTRSNFRHRPLRRCLEKVVSKILFPAPKGKRKLRFTYTVKLSVPSALDGLFQ